MRKNGPKHEFSTLIRDPCRECLVERTSSVDRENANPVSSFLHHCCRTPRCLALHSHSVPQFEFNDSIRKEVAESNYLSIHTICWYFDYKFRTCTIIWHEYSIVTIVSSLLFCFLPEILGPARLGSVVSMD